MKFYLELIPMIGAYFAIICLVNLFIILFSNAIKIPLKAVFLPANLLLIGYAIPLFSWAICWIKDWHIVAGVLYVMIVLSAIPLVRCWVRPCRIHIWIVEKALGSDHEHVAYLKRERKNNKWRKDVEHG